MKNPVKTALAVACALTFMPNFAQACASGCGIFDIGTSAMMPGNEGGTAWLDYAIAPQTRNWAGTEASDKANNEDKLVMTHTVTAGAQYMFNRSWGAQVQLPYVMRRFKATTDNPNPGDTENFNAADLGDVRLKAIYSGFFDDMSTGLTLGLKLPTGGFNEAGFDRDTQIGTGSTDLLIGAYHMGELPVPYMGWFARAEWSRAISIQDDYRPGDEVNAALGLDYDNLALGSSVRFVPMVQLLASTKQPDSGGNAKPDDTGHTQLFVAPGLEVNIYPVTLYADVAFPIYRNMNGNQLVTPIQGKFTAGYKF